MKFFSFRFSGENISSRYDNIEKKIEAEELFRNWFVAFYAGLTATSREDEFLMQDMRERVNAGINALAKLELRKKKKFCEWYRLLKK